MAQRWAVVAPARCGHALRRDLAQRPAPAPRRSRASHPGSTTAKAATGRCSTSSTRPRAPAPTRTPPRPSDEGAPPARRPEQGPDGRTDASAAPRCRARVRRARPQPRGARPEPRPRHPVRADERRHRVRRRRRRRPRHHRHRPPRPRPAPSCRGSASSATAAAASRPPSRTTRPYRTVEDLRGLRVATAHPNTARRFFEAAGHPGRHHPDLRRRRGGAAARSRRGHRRSRVDRLHARHERPAPDRRRPRVGGGPRRQSDRRSRAPRATSPPSTR